jgi:hypothetical protein
MTGSAVEDGPQRTSMASAANGSREPILLKNSVPDEKMTNRQNNFPRMHHFASNVGQRAFWENDVPNSQSEFRRAEFFNKISPL